MLLITSACLFGLALLFVLNVLNLTVTAGTINGLIFYANIVSAFESTFLPFRQPAFATVFISWLNLEIGIDACFFEGMDTYSKVWIQFLFPVYIIILDILIINCTPKCCTRSKFCHYVRKNISNSGPVLATVIFLSIINLLKPAHKAISFVVVTFPDSSTRTLWLPDANIPYFEGKHIVISLLGLFIFLLGLMYSVYILIGSRSFNFICSFVRYTPRFYLIREYYRAPYTNRFQFWSGFLILLRIVLLLISTISSGYGGDPQITTISIVVATSFLILLRTLIHEETLYKRPCVDYLEMANYFNLITFAVLTIYISDLESQNLLATTSVSVAFILFIGILIDGFCKTRMIQKLIKVLLYCHKPPTEEISVQSSSLDVSRIPNVPTFAQFREPLIESSSSRDSNDVLEELVAAPFIQKTRSRAMSTTVKVQGDHVSKNYGAVTSQPISNLTTENVISTQASTAASFKVDSSSSELEEEDTIPEQGTQDDDNIITQIFDQSSPPFIAHCKMPSESQENIQHQLLSKSCILSESDSESDFPPSDVLTSRYSHSPASLPVDLGPLATEKGKPWQTVSKFSHRSVFKYLKCAENVSSVPFVDPVTVLEFDSSGKECTNISHDITLKVPENAIPHGLVTHFELAVALYGPFQFSNDRRPISPILWICPQEDIVLQKPIEIVLPHVLNNGLTNEDISHYGLQFYKADHTDYIVKPNGRRQYAFRPLNDDMQFISDKDESFGILRTTHCCFLCITAMQNAELSQDMAQKKGYCLSCIECLHSPFTNVPPRDIVYFCTSFFLKTCLTVRLFCKAL